MTMTLPAILAIIVFIVVGGGLAIWAETKKK